jgi:rod shape-determining protein MreC
LKKASFTLARIESVSQSRLKKQIMINKGSSDNLKIGQVVLGAEGIIGQTTQITPNSSRVLMVSDPTQYIPVKNARNGIRGVSQGMAENQAHLLVKFIQPDADIKIGDIFLSSALGGKFPDDYALGRVIRAELRENEDFLYVVLEPMQKTHHLEFVLILDNL